MTWKQSKRLGRSRIDFPASSTHGWFRLSFLIGLGALVWGLGIPGVVESSQTAPSSRATPIWEVPNSPNALPLSLRNALEREGDAERGRESYTSCAVCHRDDGAGHSDGTFPQLAGQHSSIIVKQLIDIREGRRANPLMLPFANRLSGAQEIADVARYVSLLPRSNQNGKGTGEDLALGADLYERDCASCHGIEGEGDATRFIPALVGQHYGYMLRQIRDIGAGRRGNAHPEMVFLVAGYSDAELMALVDYASRIRIQKSDE